MRFFLALICFLFLTACGGQGLTPTPTEQTQLSTLSTGTSTNEQFSQSVAHRGFGRFLRGVTLTEQQQTQLRELVQQFRSAHPLGSRFDPEALRTLHQHMLAVLTPEQQIQVQQNLERWRSAMRAIALTDQQKAQIHQLIEQYRQSHPRGSAPDPEARRQLHEEIHNVLTPQQQAQLQQSFASPAPVTTPQPH